MRLLALGTGTCVHVPGTPRRMPPLFALDVSESLAPQWILFDCSEGARWRLEDAGVDPLAISRLALSHPHPDHAALPQLLQARACEAGFGRARGQALPLTVYMPRASADAIESLWRWHAPEDDGAPSARFALTVMGAGDGFCATPFAGVTLRCWEVEHGGAPALAWRVESPSGTFVYSGDSGRCDALVEAARGADLFLCECAAGLRATGAMRGRHLGAFDAGEVARDAGVRRLWLTHYDGRDDDGALLDAVRAAGFAGEARVARDGDRGEISPPA